MSLKSGTILALALILGTCSTTQANLLLNPGAETGAVAPDWGTSSLPGAPASGLSAFNIIRAVSSHGPVTPASGDFFFSMAEGNSAWGDLSPGSGDGDGIGDRLRMVQQGALPANSDLVRLTGLYQTIGPDTAEVFLTVINAANNQTATVFLTGLSSVGAWAAFDLFFDLSNLPFEATQWRVALRGRFLGDTDFGSPDLTTDVFFDDLQLIATPEASSIAIWLLGVSCGGAWLVRNTQKKQQLLEGITGSV